MKLLNLNQYFVQTLRAYVRNGKLKNHIIKQSKVKVEAVRNGQFSETSDYIIFWKFCKSLIDRLSLSQ